MFKIFKIVPILLVIIYIINLLSGQAFYLESSFRGYNTSNINIIKEKIDYYMIIEIPSISLKKYVFDIGDVRNNLDKNIELLYKKDMLILVSHSGNNDNAYFRNLKYLNIGESVYIYLNDNKYLYKVSKIYSINKKDDFGINDSFKNKLVLITCLDREKYLILECQRQNF